MTRKEENIVNIAMKAAELILNGKIEMDDIGGHMGLTNHIISLSEQFEQKTSGIDFDADGRDYWIDIDEFTEHELLAEYGREEVAPDKQINSENTIKLWARVGMTLEVTPETYEQLKTGSREPLEAVLAGTAGRAYIDGETYFPDTEQNMELCEMEFYPRDPSSLMPAPSQNKPHYKADLTIPESKANFLNELLSMTGPEIYDKYGLKRDETITNTIKFENGYELDVKVVICEEDTPYIDLVLFDEKGRECGCDVGEDSIEGPITFELEDAFYTGTIEIEREIERVNDAAVEYQEPPVKVYAVSSGGIKMPIFTGNWDECKDFCQLHDWTYVDPESRFEWNLEMEDSRENSFPDGFLTAIANFKDENGNSIDCEFVRQHAEELVICYQKDMDLLDFDFWTQYETLLNISISYDEYIRLDNAYGGDPMELTPDSDEAILWGLQGLLSDIREALAAKEGSRPSLNEQIQNAENRLTKEPDKFSENSHER